MNVAQGDATCRGNRNEKVWLVHWSKAKILVPSDSGTKLKTGAMVGVHGEIFKKNNVACRFRSDDGDADNTQKILVLRHHVRIESPQPVVTLLADRVVYDGVRKLFKAKGHVQVQGTMGTVGTLDEMWANQDLTRIGSPGLFKQP